MWKISRRRMTETAKINCRHWINGTLSHCDKRLLAAQLELNKWYALPKLEFILFTFSRISQSQRYEIVYTKQNELEDSSQEIQHISSNFYLNQFYCLYTILSNQFCAIYVYISVLFLQSTEITFMTSNHFARMFVQMRRLAWLMPISVALPSVGLVSGKFSIYFPQMNRYNCTYAHISVCVNCNWERTRKWNIDYKSISPFYEAWIYKNQMPLT